MKIKVDKTRTFCCLGIITNSLLLFYVLLDVATAIDNVKAKAKKKKMKKKTDSSS